MENAQEESLPPAPIRLALPHVFSGVVVRSVQSDLLAALRTHTPVTLLGSEVDEAGTAAVQLIECASRDFASEGLELRIADPSDGLCQAFEQLGLFSDLMQLIEMPPMDAEGGMDFDLPTETGGGTDGW